MNFVRAGIPKRVPFWTYWKRRRVLNDLLQDVFEEGLQLLGEHLILVLSSILIAAAIAIPLGVFVAANARARGLALGIANIGQTIPSLALFGFLIPIPFIGGIGQHTAIIALVVYALLPILRNTVTGILGVDPAVRDSAIAMGMTRGQILRMVELPLAAPTIISGLRIATVTTVGTATIAAAIGAGGLGVFIFRGIASVDKVQILAGAVPAALLALGADGALGWLERRWAAH
jgi:osmoprotectant transport system permease protein